MPQSLPWQAFTGISKWLLIFCWVWLAQNHTCLFLCICKAQGTLNQKEHCQAKQNLRGVQGIYQWGPCDNLIWQKWPVIASRQGRLEQANSHWICATWFLHSIFEMIGIHYFESCVWFASTILIRGTNSRAVRKYCLFFCFWNKSSVWRIGVVMDLDMLALENKSQFH